MPNMRQTYKSIVKDSVIGFLCIVVIILLLLRGCGNKKEEKKPEPTIVYDTIYKEERIDTLFIPKPYAVYLPGNVPKPLEKWDTLYIPDEVDTAAILEDYHSFYIYSDTIKNKYGYVVIDDTISRNKIYSRGATTRLQIPEVTRTITLVQPKRSALFIGAGVFGNQNDIAAGYNVNLSMKTKKDRMLEVGYNQFFGGKGYFTIGYKQKISFRK